MRYGFFAKVRRAAIVFGGMSLMLGSQAFGQECTTEPVCGTAQCGPSCLECEQIFARHGAKLSEQLGALSAQCCQQPVCTDVCTDVCGDGCTDVCGDSCGVATCDDGCGFSLMDLCGDTDTGGISFGGWTQIGYHNNSTGLFNSHPDQLNLHQQWFYLEKVADGSNGLDWGFRADIMYGTDGADTQAFANPPGTWDFANGWDNGIYGGAIPQLYAEIAEGDWSVIAGHFYTLVGYEVVTAPDNFFYSHAYTMYNSEPFTHTGVLATYAASENVEVYGGWTLGWDTGFEQSGGGSSFLGGVSLAATDDVSVTYITTIGNFGGDPKLGVGRGNQPANGYSHSIVIDANITDKLNYVFQSDLVDTDAGGGLAPAVDAENNGDHQVGINQYLIYTVNDMVGVGTRLEWWKNAGNSQYEVTFGTNVRPIDNVVVRPEIRHDWNPGQQNDFTTFGIDTIFTY